MAVIYYNHFKNQKFTIYYLPLKDFLLTNRFDKATFLFGFERNFFRIRTFCTASKQ